MNGDFVDGTGLSADPPCVLTALLRRMPWDAVNVGNHELYRNSTVEYIAEEGGFVDFWNGTYLTSNVLSKATAEPLGARFCFLEGRRSDARVLTFGFLYDMRDHCEDAVVETVERAVESTWFRRALDGTEGRFDAVLVLAHMDFRDPLVDLLLRRIRAVCGDDMPVQFVAGHSHVWGLRTLDPNAAAFEAGRYLDTVGLVSFPAAAEVRGGAAPSRHVFLDANVDILRRFLGAEDLATDPGAQLSADIRRTQEEMGLLDVVGCAPRTYRFKGDLAAADSLWGFFIRGGPARAVRRRRGKAPDGQRRVPAVRPVRGGGDPHGSDLRGDFSIHKHNHILVYISIIV
mmetsp:Transcript_17816/g.40466  ORF Transcript_17816/g.40466 Transcript_17816/m.40466 type:complete len:344 (-) Transcript_17816:8-1039(-)